MPESITCNLCGADDYDVVYQARDERFRTDEINWSLVRCQECGLCYLNPRPTSDEIDRYYPRAYFTTGRDIQSQHRRYAAEARYLAGLTPGNLLDIGCAEGDFPAFMRDRGWAVAGFEGSRSALNPHRIEIRRGRFPEDCDFSADSFDAITAWAVIEHLHDPMSALRTIHNLLKPGGSLVFLVPNFRSVHSRLARFEDIPRHLYFFTPDTARSCLAAAGLDVVDIDFDGTVYPAPGRGALRRLLWHAAGGDERGFYEFLHYRTRRERMRSRPLFGALWHLTAAVERVLLADRPQQWFGVYGTMVVSAVKPRAAA
ncbi:MAG: class I SAM-dependent methyltransferase [Solirubrobacterales bacterium]